MTERREVQGPGGDAPRARSTAPPPTSGCSTPAARRDWVHTDPWRVLRIQAEFVEGFGALAELGPAIAVLRLGAHQARRPDYAKGEEVGRKLAEAGFAVITGGGPGAMEAANKGASEAGGTSVGLGIELPFEIGPQPVGRHRHQLPLLLRPQDDVREVLPGLRRAARRPRHPRRAVRGADAGADPEGHLVPGRAARRRLLAGLIDWLRDTVLADGKITQSDLDMLTLTDDVDEAVALMVAAREHA